MSDDCAEKTVETELEIEGRKVKVRAQVERQLPPWGKTTLVGKSMRRVDGPDKVTGAARYTHDVQLPGMLYGKVLRSPHARARVAELGLSAAAKLPGVLAVLGPGDVRGVRLGGREVLSAEASYAGEEIAALAATDEETAEEALSLIRVRWEPLPHILEPEDAMAPGAPALQPGGNVLGGGFGPQTPGKPEVYERGDAPAALAAAEVELARVYETPAAQHTCLETHGAVAAWDGDGLTVWESTQGVFFVRAALCEALGLPASRVRVLCPFMGGGFGSKNSADRHTLLAALLARRSGRPVRMVLSRREDFEAGAYRPASRQQMAIGLTRRGRIVALTSRAVNPVGAALEGHYFGSCVGPVHDFYACANVRTENYAILTSSPPPSAFRAPGHVQGAFALEQLVDEAADELGLDPVRLRLANLSANDPDSGQPFASNGLASCLRLGAKAIGWDSRKPPRAKAGRFRSGLGVAIATWGAGGGPPAVAQVVLHEDGSVVVLTGACDLGTGTRTVMTQIAAEELGVAVSTVLVANADTRTTPYCLPSFGSLTVASTGPAVRLAAAEVKRQLLDAASPILEAPASSLLVMRGKVRHAVTGKSVAVASIAASLPARMIVGTSQRGPNPDGLVLASFSAQFAQVEVDCRFGTVRVKRFVSAHDCGRVLNPATWSSQIQGGVLQGIGYALLEQRTRDPGTGRQLNAGLLDYKIPTALDSPPEIEVIDAAPPYPANNIGAKGSGEPPIIPVAAAIANAVANATGRRLRTAPITPARLLAALSAEP